MPQTDTSEPLVELTPASPTAAPPPPPPAPAAQDLDEFNPAWDMEPEDYADLQDYREKHAKPAAPAPPPPAPEPEPLPGWLTREAEQIGVKPDELKGMTTAQAEGYLDRRVRLFEARREQPARRDQPPPTPAAPVAPAEPEDVLAKLGIDRSKFDDDTAETLEKIARHADERIKKVEETYKTVAQREAERQAERDWQLLDKAIFNDHPEVYGKGPIAELDDPAAAERRAVVMTKLRELVQTGKQGKSLKEDADRIHRQLFGFAAPASPPTASGTIAAGYTNGAGKPPVPAKPAPNPDQPKDPVTGKFVRKDADEHRARQEAWMDSTSPAPTDRTEGELPLGDDRALRGIQRRVAMLAQTRRADGDED